MHDDKQRCVLVRRTPRHSCVAHIVIKHAPRGIELIRVSPDMGDAPDVGDMTQSCYHSLRELRADILARMRQKLHTKEAK